MAVKIYRFLAQHPDTWFSNGEIARGLNKTEAIMAVRTVRAHTRHFVELGILAKMHLFPGDRFKFESTNEHFEQAQVVLGAGGRPGAEAPGECNVLSPEISKRVKLDGAEQ